MRRITALAITLAVCGAAPANAAASTVPGLKRQLRAALKSRDAWKAREQHSRAVIREDSGLLSSVNTRLSQATAQLSTVTQQRDSLAAMNTALMGPVATQVAAIAQTGDPSMLQTFVLNPAHTAWVCQGSIFVGQTFMSYDFNLRSALTGDCF